MVCLFCAVNITGDIKKFVQTLNLLNETKIVEIWTKCFIVLSDLDLFGNNKSRFRNKKTCRRGKFFFYLRYFSCFALGFLSHKCYWGAILKSQGGAKVRPPPLYPPQQTTFWKRQDPIDIRKYRKATFCYYVIIQIQNILTQKLARVIAKTCF